MSALDQITHRLIEIDIQSQLLRAKGRQPNANFPLLREEIKGLHFQLDYMQDWFIENIPTQSLLRDPRSMTFS